MFVGRKSKLKELIARLESGARNQGGVIFIEGQAGIGKTSFLEQLKDEAAQIPHLSKIHFIQGNCLMDIGEQSAYQPFIDMLSTNSVKRNGIGELFSSIFKETASD